MQSSCVRFCVGSCSIFSSGRMGACLEAQCQHWLLVMRRSIPSIPPPLLAPHRARSLRCLRACCCSRPVTWCTRGRQVRRAPPRPPKPCTCPAAPARAPHSGARCAAWQPATLPAQLVLQPPWPCVALSTPTLELARPARPPVWRHHKRAPSAEGAVDFFSGVGFPLPALTNPADHFLCVCLGALRACRCR